MAVTPTNSVSLPLSRLRNLIAKSAAFQSWVGAASSAAAEAFIYIPGVEHSGIDYTKPFIVLGHDSWAAGRDQMFNAEEGCFVPEGWVRAILRAPRNTALSKADAEFTFTNKLGAIIEQIGAVCGRGGYIAVDRFEFDGPPHQVNSPHEQSSTAATAGAGDYSRGVLRLHWRDYLA